jgi:hypothetical protein
MTRAEEYRNRVQRKGQPKRTAVKKPKRAAWGRDKQHAAAKATHALEVVSKGRPSRKSTRASANRAKSDAPMNLTEEARKGAPRMLANKDRAKRQRVRGAGSSP